MRRAQRGHTRYDAASNLIKEVYDKQGGAVGDRFEYDGFHRLLDGWLGVDSTTMNMGTINEEEAEFVQRLTYSLDDAGNRDWVNIQDGPEATPDTDDYTIQGSWNEDQGPSNRYHSVALGVSENLVYDYRGNLIYDERNSLAYEYDFKNRLSEVYSVSESFSASSGSSTGLVSSAHLYDPDTIHRAQAEIRRNTGGPEEILKNHGRPEWRWRLSAPLRTGDGKEDEEPKEGGGLEPAPSGPSVGEEAESFEFTLTLIAVYVHDGFNRRVVRARLGEATYMSAYDGWREVEECVKSGNSTVPIKQFVWGERLDEQIAYREWNGSGFDNYFVHNGGQDSITRIVDDTGTVVEIKEYDPYGIETSYGTGTLNPYSWKGHRLDPETGLIYMRNRYYSPELGRFMTHDPLGVWADGLNLGNGYAYGANAPQKFRDPFGLQVDNVPPDTSLLGFDYVPIDMELFPSGAGLSGTLNETARFASR